MSHLCAKPFSDSTHHQVIKTRTSLVTSQDLPTTHTHTLLATQFHSSIQQDRYSLPLASPPHFIAWPCTRVIFKSWPQHSLLWEFFPDAPKLSMFLGAWNATVHKSLHETFSSLDHGGKLSWVLGDPSPIGRTPSV